MKVEGAQTRISFNGRKNRDQLPDLWKMTSSPSFEPAPNTIMRHAFLLALFNLATRRAHSRQRVMLPIGSVDASELRRVLVALTCARAEQ